MRVAAILLAFLPLVLPASANEIACTGAFAIDSSAARLVEIYGAENVVTVDSSSGDVAAPATVVYPDDPARRMRFVWWHGEALADPSYIEFPSAAVLPRGLTVGMTIAEVEALNGGPFTLAGFSEDLGGYTHFRNGLLADLDGDCTLSADFRPANHAGDPDTRPATNGADIASDDPRLTKVDMRLNAILLGYVHPDFR